MDCYNSHFSTVTSSTAQVLDGQGLDGKADLLIKKTSKRGGKRKRMLNNGHGGMGNGPDGPGQQQGPGGMYTVKTEAVYGNHPGGPSDYPQNNSYLGGPPHPSSGNGLHSSGGGICSQMTLNQNACPPNNKHCHTCPICGDPRWCSGCGGAIMERYLLHCLDRHWHNTCLKCGVCGNILAELGQSCWFREGMTLCRSDYLKMFGSSGACASCGQCIPPSEFVMRASVSPPGSSPPLVYHVKCFSCDACKRQLSTGDRYSVLNGTLFCGEDAMKLMKTGIASPNTNVTTTNGPARKGKVGRPRRSRD